MISHIALASLVASAAISVAAQSVLTSRLDDPRAVYLTAQEFGAHADGVADDSAAIQAAIDHSQDSARAAGNPREGIVFIPSGRYRIARTIFVWPGIRVFGYGPTRPVLVLAPNTPGFQTGIGDMVIFTGARSSDGSPYSSHAWWRR